MSTRKLGVALGAAVLLLGMPTYALAGADQKPDKPGKGLHQCEDGQDNDGDGHYDFGGGPEGEPADPDCGSPRDNSEGPDDDETGGEDPGTPGLPVDPATLPGELQALVEEVIGQLPPGGGEPPALPVTPEDVQALVEELTGQLPPGGGEPPALPADPATLLGEAQAAAEELIGQLPPPPA